ncbi:hypothetical protein lerEdw1_001079 [Lerista edwardsae]|nr:hypothetical protein lerEdw1_001079 [Lerista edwardsae]
MTYWAFLRGLMLCNVCFAPVYAAGISGTKEHEEDFRFCGHRMQTRKSSIHYKMQKDTLMSILIVNSRDGLNITAPFPPEPKGAHPSGPLTFPLQDPLGTYRFCLYWIRNTQLFVFQYGSKNYTLSKRANYSLCSPNISEENTNYTGTPVLYNVSYASKKVSSNASLPDLLGYNFVIKDSGKCGFASSDQENYADNLRKDLEYALTSNKRGRKNSPRPLYQQLQDLESQLGLLKFNGQNKTLGEGTVLCAHVLKVPLDRKSPGMSFKSGLEEGKDVRGFEVTLPEMLFPKVKGRHEQNSEMKVVLMDITSQLPFQARIWGKDYEFFQKQGWPPRDPNASQIVGKKVIGISLGNSPVFGLPKEQRVVLTFWHNQLPSNVTPQCVFWDTGPNASPLGSWSTSGCEVKGETNHTTCLCDHLTFFAVLMSYSSEIDSRHQRYLSVITYVGCIISAVAAFLTICFFLCSRRQQRDHIVYVHMNLLWAIFLLDMSFLIAMPLAPSSGDAACKASAMFLHFGLLACLTWMGIEGYSLYRLVIEVFNSYVKHFLLKLCLVGWGLPLLLVSLIFVINRSHYGQVSIKVYESSERYTNATICWITEGRINSFLNLGLLSLVLLFNSVMLATMVREILKLKHWEPQWKYVVMLLGLSCVLGIPWGIVFFSFTSGTFKLVAIYLTTIINSLQGFLIFLWYLAKVLQTRKSSSIQFTSSNSIRAQSFGSSL